MHPRRTPSLRFLAPLAVTLALSATTVARAHVELGATLDVAQEVPAVSTPSTATGTATLLLEPDGRITGEVTVQNLLSPPVFAHIHEGPVGVQGNVIFTLDDSPITGTSGTITVETTPLNEAQMQTLFEGGLYVNFHTVENIAGELRGQITVLPGLCDCDTLSSKDFKKCVKGAIKGLEKDDKKSTPVKALKKAIAKASCGKTKAPKKAIACCLPLNPIENIVTDALCAVVPEKKCASLGGTSMGVGSSCIPTNPCVSSPSGAFLN